MSTRPWAELIGGLTTLQQRKLVLLRRLSQFAQAPHIYWRALDDAYLEFPENSAELILCDPRVGVSEREVEVLRRWLSQ